jgi:hypothetical protein
MKNSKEYSEKVNKLFRKLKKGGVKVEQIDYEEPVDSLIYATIGENTTKSEARKALRRAQDYFVDMNELRVSRNDEIEEVLGGKGEEFSNTAIRLRTLLNNIFNKYNSLTLKALKKEGKRPAKEALEKIEGVSSYAVNYCMLLSLGGHAIPLTSKMLVYLRGNDLVHPDATEQEIEGFLARLIPANKGYEFYYLLRLASDKYKPRKVRKKSAASQEKPKVSKSDTKRAAKKKKKTKTKKTTKKPSAKKSTKKKKTTRSASKSRSGKTKKTTKKRTTKKKTSKKKVTKRRTKKK